MKILTGFFLCCVVAEMAICAQQGAPSLPTPPQNMIAYKMASLHITKINVTAAPAAVPTPPKIVPKTPAQILPKPTIVLHPKRSVCTHPTPGGLIQGIGNAGNTCYLNATLQALCASKVLRDALGRAASETANHLKNIFEAIGKKDACNIAPFLGNVVAKLLEEQPKNPLLQNLRGLLENTNSGGQQDAHELITALTDKISDDLDVVVQKNAGVKNNIKGQIATMITGACGHHNNLPIEDFKTLSIALSSCNTTLTQCIEDFLKPELLTANNQWFCAECNKKVNATRQTALRALPDLLIIQLKRCNNTQQKLSTPVKYEDKLTISGQNGVAQSYTLKSVIIHCGSSIGGGHYISSVLGPDHQWYTANDSSVTKGRSDSPQSAYVLLYEKE